MHLAVFESKNASCVNSAFLFFFFLGCSQFGFFRLLASLVTDSVLINLSSTAPCMNCTKSLPACILQLAAHGEIYSSTRPLSISYSHPPFTVHSVQTSRNTWPLFRLSTESSNMLTASSVAAGFKCFYCQYKPISISARCKQPSCSWFVSFFFVWRVAMAFCDIQKLFVDFASFQARYPGSLLVPLCPSEISKLLCAHMDYQSVVTLCLFFMLYCT